MADLDDLRAKNLPDDHPDRWQWEYAGGKEEREGLLERLAGGEGEDDEEQPEQEEALF